MYDGSEVDIFNSREEIVGENLIDSKGWIVQKTSAWKLTT